jgi:hypothetical protein
MCQHPAPQLQSSLLADFALARSHCHHRQQASAEVNFSVRVGETIETKLGPGLGGEYSLKLSFESFANSHLLLKLIVELFDPEIDTEYMPHFSSYRFLSSSLLKRGALDTDCSFVISMRAP